MTRSQRLLALAALLAACFCGRASAVPACSQCSVAAGAAQGLLQSSDHLSRLEKSLTTKLCTTRDDQACATGVQAIVQGLARKSETPAEQLCSKQACASSSQANSVECPMCKFIVTTVKARVDTPEAEQKLVDRAVEACKSLPQEFQQQCLDYVAQYAPQIFAIIDDVDPAALCEMVGACVQPPAAVAAAIIDAFNTLQQQRQGGEVVLQQAPNNDDCDTCKLVVLEAGAILRNPDTQKEILDYAEQACHTFHQYEDQCLEYVHQYGPLAIGIVLQYMQPDLVCNELGFCPKPPSPPTGIASA